MGISFEGLIVFYSHMIRCAGPDPRIIAYVMLR